MKNPVTSAVKRGPRSYQEDYNFQIRIKNSSVQGWLIAVMDGHGGKSVAEICAQEMGKLFQPQTAIQSEETLRSLVEALHAKTLHFRDVGSTLSVAYILASHHKVSIAVLGDSPVAVLDQKGQLHLSPEHNVRSNAKERIAAEQRGGVYREGYLYTRGGDHGLQLTRALGDTHLNGVISHEPDIYTINDPQWILVASDGLFDPSHSNTNRLLEEMKEYAKQRSTADDLMKWAEKRGLKDNATAVVWRR